MQRSIPSNVIRAFFVVICIYVGITAAMGEAMDKAWIGALAGLGFALTVLLIDLGLRNFSIRGFSTGTVGLLIGFLCAWLVTRIGFFESGWMEQFELAGNIFRMAVYLAFGFIGTMLALRSKREEFSLLIPYVRFRQESLQELPTVLDSNVIIDGRVPAVISAGFLGGTLLVPRFVLEELQLLADSGNESKRNLGKRGLESLNRMQSSSDYEVIIEDRKSIDGETVDSQLIAFCQTQNARILTNDANLAKVARLQGVTVLNLNELAKALRPRVSTGDRIELDLIKKGKDPAQAIGYLPDGTMIVVNEAAAAVGSTQTVIIASSTPTSAGRLIFADLE